MFMVLFSAVMTGAIILVIVRYRNQKWARESGYKAPILDSKETPKGYTYKDFVKDLSDESVGIAEIIERCQGVSPPGSDAEKHNAKVLQGPAGDPLPGAPRLAQTDVPRTVNDTPEDRQMWFAQIAKEVGMVKLVAPPVAQPVVAVNGMMIRCACRSGLLSSTVQSSFPPHRTGPFRPVSGGGSSGMVRPEVKCTKCNDTGFVIMTIGK